ncbi:MAG: hypothetical protein ACKJSG_17975, partial [Lentisphaeria bacterium]
MLKNHIEKLRDVSSVHGQTARNSFTLMESLAYSAPLDDSQDGKLLIGVDQDSGGFNQHMFGFIDEVVIFDRGITALEVVD